MRVCHAFWYNSLLCRAMWDCLRALNLTGIKALGCHLDRGRNYDACWVIMFHIVYFAACDDLIVCFVPSLKKSYNDLLLEEEWSEGATCRK